MKFIPDAMSRTVGRQLLNAQKHSPRMLFVAGVVGVATSTVLACKATLKVNDIIDDVEAEVEGIKTNLGTTDGYNKDLVYVYAKGAGRIGQLYGPAIVVGSISVAALTGSHIQLSRRNAGLTAAYAAVSKAYDDYRDRVRDELGEEKELNLYHAATNQDVIGDDKKKTTVLVSDPNKYSPYAKFFDEYNVHWTKNPELNRVFVQAQQRYANDLLRSRGHIFLNEVYDMLGIERSSAGSVVGWILTRDGGEGDDYVDFGMFEAANADFINGVERSILLDFNVDGVIYNKLG